MYALHSTNQIQGLVLARISVLEHLQGSCTRIEMPAGTELGIHRMRVHTEIRGRAQRQRGAGRQRLRQLPSSIEPRPSKLDLLRRKVGSKGFAEAA